MAKVKAEKIKPKKFTFDDFELVLLSLPTVIWYAIFSFLPMIGIIIAFKRYKIVPGKGFIVSLIKSDWVALKNFDYLFKTKDAILSIRNTLLYNAFFIAIGILIPVTLAIMISNLYSQKYAKVCQTMMFLPHFMSWVVASYFLVAFLDTEKGMIPNLILSLTGEQVSFYSDPASTKYWPLILTIMRLWKGTGYGMVVYLASITGFDATYYEAAVIDGATKWQQTKYITIPLLKQIIVILLIMDIGKIFNSDFGLFYQVPRNSGAVQSATITLDVYVYNALRQLNNIGMSSAAAFFQSVCGCITILIANSIVKKIDEESSFF